MQKKMTHNVIKEAKGGKFIYTFNGKVVRTSKKEYRYACIATNKNDTFSYNPETGKCDIPAPAGSLARIISFGNKVDSTYNSMAQFYRERNNLEVVEIQ